MAAPELSTGQTQANYTNRYDAMRLVLTTLCLASLPMQCNRNCVSHNSYLCIRLSRVIHRIAHLEIDYGDASYMLSIDSPLLLFEVTSAVHLSQYVFNGSKQASVHLPASLLEPAELESSASGQVSAIQSYVSSPGNIAYMAQYKSDVLFQHGVVVQDSCQLDDCHKRWSGATVNAAVISVGTDKAADSLNETAVVNLVFESLQVTSLWFNWCVYVMLSVCRMLLILYVFTGTTEHMVGFVYFSVGLILMLTLMPFSQVVKEAGYATGVLSSLGSITRQHVNAP